MKKNVKGITLIALVVTIIVLLILAGVSIAVLTGENSIINRATEAKQTNKQKTAEEELKLGVSALSIDYRKSTTNSQTFREFVTSNSGANLKTAMGLALDNQDLVVENATNGVISYKGQKYQVDNFGKIAEYVPGWEQTKTSVTKDGIELTVGQAVTGYSVEVNSTTVGDGNWYVLGAKDGKLLITTNTNPESVQLSGKDGYTGGVATLNAAAEKYTNSNLANGNARVIDVDDINRVTGYKESEAQYNAGTNNVSQWDNDVTYTLVTDAQENKKIYYKGTKYPIYEANQLGAESTYSSFEYWNRSDWIKLGEGANPVKSDPIKNTYYSYYPNTLTTSSSGDTVGIATNSPAYTLLFAGTNPWDSPNKAYWLGSQYVFCYEGIARFGLRLVRYGYLYSDALYSSNGNANSPSNGLRPVVTLASDVKVDSDGKISK